jgi:polysaccharide export outer membrane protein
MPELMDSLCKAFWAAHFAHTPCWAWLAVVALCAGCGGPRVYQASKLPPELLAPSLENVHTIDFSRLAAQSLNSKQIGTGDLLDVTIETGHGDPAEALPVRVADDGTATIPIVGKLSLAGMEPEVAERLIAAAAIERGFYRNPTVTVDVRRQRTNRVTVIGAVETPDTYEIPSGASSLLAALVAAGGLSSGAGTSVEIRRPAAPDVAMNGGVTPVGYRAQAPRGPTSLHVDLIDATRNDRGAMMLNDGDVVMVETRDPQPFDVLGLVTKPGRFELPANKNIHVLDALAMAGGLSTPWADKAHLIRQPQGQSEPVVVEISIKAAKQRGDGNLRMMPGDVVSVEQTPTTIVTGFLRAVAPYSVTAAVPFIK